MEYVDEFTAGVPQMVPHSREAEEALCGVVTINPEAMFELRDLVRHGDFYIHRNQWVWEAYERLWDRKEPIDFVTVTEELDKMGHLVNIGGAAYLTKLTNNVPSSLHGKAYAKRVVLTAKLRKLLGIGGQVAKDAYLDDPNINEIVATHIKNLNELTTVTDTGKSLAMVISNTADLVLERIDMRARGEDIEIGYQTGIPYIDRNFKGIKKSWLVYVAGSPNVGKTKQATQISAVLARQDPGCYIALEGDDQSTALRLLESRVGVSTTDIEFGKVSAGAIKQAVKELSNLEYEFFYAPRLSVHELRAYVSNQKATRNIGWIVIDYVSLLTVPGVTDKNDKDEYMSQELRRITSEFNIMTWGLDSIVKSGANKILSLEDIAGRFSKQHDSDITFGYSDYKVIKGLTEEIDSDRQRDCRLLGVLKDRHRGNKGKIMPLELINGAVTDFKEEDNGFVPHYMDDR